MYDKHYRYKSKDFFHLQRFPLLVGFLLFLGVELVFLLPAMAIMADTVTTTNIPPGLWDCIEFSLGLAVLCAAHYVLFFLTLRTRQGVGEKGLYNARKGLLPWEKIGTMHLASENCTAEKYDENHRYKSIFTLGPGGAAIAWMFVNAQQKNQLILHVKGLEYKPRNSFLSFLLGPSCGNVIFKIDLPVLGKKELVGQFDIRLNGHPDWERVKSALLK